MAKRKLRIEVACQQVNITGESPIWSARDQALYWVDIRGGTVNRLTEGNKHTAWSMGRNVGAVGINGRGGLLVTMDDGVFELVLDETPGSVRLTPIAQPELKDGVRLKEGKVDPEGRWWCGSTGASRELRHGALFRLSGSLEEVDDGFILVNGLAFSPDRRRLIMSDSPDDIVYAYDYNAADGSISNRREFFSTANFPGAVDGATFDEEGGYWGAMVGDWSVARFDSAGHMDQLVRLPVRFPTMCAFGGPDLDILYVTTATHHLRDYERAAQPQAGMLFAIHGLGVRGVTEPEYQSRS